MTSKRLKKTPDNSVLCGLRSATPLETNTNSKPPDSRGSRPAIDSSAFNIDPSPRPESLTLPFENRDRASHLISDEELERILRQSELESPVPRLPTGLSSGLSGLGLRRSLSTAKHAKPSIFAPRPRPASTNFSGSIAQRLGQHADDRIEQAGYSRDPTLTALPRPPTKNDMAVYPSLSRIRPPTPYPGSLGIRRHHDASTNYSQPPTPGRQRFTSLLHPERSDQQGHKRKFSLSLAATGMIESVKKRIKRPDSPPPPSMRISSPIISSPTPIRPRPASYHFPSHAAIYPNADPNSHSVAHPDDDFSSDNDNDSVVRTNLRTDSPAGTEKKVSSTKKVLRRAWSFTKDAAKETFELANPLPRITKMKEPDFVEVRAPSRSAVAGPVPAASPNINTPAPSTIDTSFFTIGDPSSFAANSAQPIQRSRPWETAPREVLGGEIERLEGRTMDLLARNEGYRNEINYLRARIGELETSEVVKRRAVEDEDEDEDDGEHDEEDKRKTWMTCDSE